MNAKEFIIQRIKNDWNGKIYLGFYEDEEIDIFEMMELYAQSKAENLPISDVRDRLNDFLSKQQDIPGEVQKVINEKFWDLI